MKNKNILFAAAIAGFLVTAGYGLYWAGMGGFNWSSQHQIIEQILDTRPALRPEFSNPVFFVVWNSMH